MASKKLLQAIMVTTELTGTELSEAAARVFADDLSLFPEEQVLAALQRCRREVKGRLVIADVINRIDDGRPGPDEAWSMIPRDEAQTVVWTSEMAQAFGSANPLLAEGDQVAARMAFIETYKKLVMESRNNNTPVKWLPSLGHDPAGREDVIMQAVEAGRLTQNHAKKLIPHIEEKKLLSGKAQKIGTLVKNIKIPSGKDVA